MKKIKALQIIVLLFLMVLFGGWGKIGHQIISRNSKLFFPNEMKPLFYWTDILIEHASDADNRKSNNNSESRKHYIDIDNYKEFVSGKKIIQDYDSIVTKYGLSFVNDQGTLPWAIIETYDSLKNTLKRSDFNKAALIAADLGHYVADSYMPLHITKNYNGQYSGQSGIHSRYETTMISKYQTQFNYNGRSAEQISTISDFTFNMIYRNYAYVDSVLFSDSLSSAISGNTSSDQYYAKMWETSGRFTDSLFANASYSLACLIYSAWIEAGKPNPSATEVIQNNGIPVKFLLDQNYPNPFNPETVINFQIYESGFVTLKVYDLLGKEVAALVNENKLPGKYYSIFSSQSLNCSSGIYFYKLTTGSISQTKKMILIRQY